MKYCTSDIILHIEMSIVNLKIIFVKKQKQTRERPTQGWGATFIITEMAVFTLDLEMDHPSETSLCTVAPSPQTTLLRFFF